PTRFNIVPCWRVGLTSCRRIPSAHGFTIPVRIICITLFRELSFLTTRILRIPPLGCQGLDRSIPDPSDAATRPDENGLGNGAHFVCFSVCRHAAGALMESVR